MTLQEHYKYHSRKSMKPYLKLLLLLVIVIACSGTISRYTNEAIYNSFIDIAKWSIIINGENITNDTSELTNINLYNVKDNTTNIDSGDECYFDLIINPTTTEVAISYSIDLNLVNSNLPTGTIITKYEKYENTGTDETKSNEEDVNTTSLNLIEKINLPESKTSLDNTSIRRYRVYCKIPFPAEIVKGNGFSVDAQIAVRQLIEE